MLLLRKTDEVHVIGAADSGHLGYKKSSLIIKTQQNYSNMAYFGIYQSISVSIKRCKMQIINSNTGLT